MIEKIWIFIFGSCIGSFLNVCIYRMPKEISVIKPSSFCPKCNSSIKWYDNIPILGYFFLKGKCRNCKEKISFRYPLVEFTTAVLFLSLYMKYEFIGPGFAINSVLLLNFLKFAFFFSLLIIVSLIDIDYRAIPVLLCFIGISVGIVFSIYESVEFIKNNAFFDMFSLPVVNSFKGLIFGFGFTYFFKFFGDVFLNLYLSLRKKESIEGENESLGLGDVDFIGMVGVFLGWKMAILTFFVAPFIALFYTLFALIFKRSHVIPYLPYLSLAALFCFIWGDKVLTLLH
ncbi:MAG: prepilin peptidase [Candidatus Omnitrophica bacterium]|nr:prepilin peptidase [Candidatus Omnitrophota bacterium]